MAGITGSTVNMDRQTDIMQLVTNTLQAAQFAVLTTEHDGQPHASLVAITPAEHCRHLLFATYRDTRKYRNLATNTKVALFIDARDMTAPSLRGGIVLTALGTAEEIGEVARALPLNEHLKRHPELESFLRSEGCALFRVIVRAYQVVRGVDDVRWLIVDGDLATGDKETLPTGRKS